MESSTGSSPTEPLQTLGRLVATTLPRARLHGADRRGRPSADLGLVTRIADDPLAAANALAAEIAAGSPDAIRRIKRLATEAPKLSAAEGWRGAELQKH